MQVAAMQIYSEMNRGHEYANEMRRVNKALKECQQMGAIYNNRERLLGLPVTNVSLYPLLINN